MTAAISPLKCSFLFAFIILANVFGADTLSAPEEAPVEVFEVSTAAPSPAPSFKEFETPVVVQLGDIDQPMFESPVAPPPISESHQITGFVITLVSACGVAAAL